MPEVASFRLVLQGGLAERHFIEGYDGFTALAGAAWAMSLVTNYVETGKIRHRGEFVGRHAVVAEPMGRGSLIADFKVLLHGNAAAKFELPEGSSTGLLYGLVQRVIQRNTGLPTQPLNLETAEVVDRRSGDVEALVTATEPSIRRAHDVIGNSASNVDWVGGMSMMGNLNSSTKAYMKDTIPDPTVLTREVTVSGFFGNNGRGLIFDPELGRNISVSMSVETLRAVGPVFSYGLDQYVNKTGNTITIRFTRMLSSDRRPKHYIVLGAFPTRGLTQSTPA